MLLECIPLRKPTRIARLASTFSFAADTPRQKHPRIPARRRRRTSAGASGPNRCQISEERQNQKVVRQPQTLSDPPMTVSSLPSLRALPLNGLLSGLPPAAAEASAVAPP